MKSPPTISTPLLSRSLVSSFSFNVFYLNTLRVLLQNIWYLKWAAGADSVLPHLKHELSSTEKTLYNTCGMLSFFLMDLLIMFVQFCRLRERKARITRITRITRVDARRAVGGGTPLDQSTSVNFLPTQEVLRDEKNTNVHFAYMGFRPLVAIGYFAIEESDELTIIFFSILSGLALMSNAFSFYKCRKDVKYLNEWKARANNVEQAQVDAGHEHRYVKMQSAKLNLLFSVIGLIATALWTPYPGECGIEFFTINLIQLAANYVCDAKIREKGEAFSTFLAI